ncbi:MAG TPA: polysaccharide deacetylase family protein [Blastocatellia bacterium]|nr:polysaccharide deacetylase family protein [Blastocatellia bacterium]
MVTVSAGPTAEYDGPARARFSDRLFALIKDAVFFVYLHCGYIQLRDAILSLLGRSRVAVLYYHRVGGLDVLTRPADEFQRDLAYLKRNYECMSLNQLVERLRTGGLFKRRAAVITFDDGYRDNFTEAVPALKAAGMTATFFVATGFIGTPREFPHDLRGESGEESGCVGARRPKLTWDDLRAMQAAGFEIGSHTVNHINLGRADAETIEREVRESLAALDRELGDRPRPFSFPWGKPEDISERARDAVKSAGYYAAVSAYGGANTRGSQVFNIRRVDVGNGYLSRLGMRARVAGLDPDFFRLKIANREQRR